MSSGLQKRIGHFTTTIPVTKDGAGGATDEVSIYTAVALVGAQWVAATAAHIAQAEVIVGVAQNTAAVGEALEVCIAGQTLIVSAGALALGDAVDPTGAATTTDAQTLGQCVEGVAGAATLASIFLTTL